MSKLLKHFGLGYGSSKKSETFDFRAKTLPNTSSDRRRSVNVFADTGRRNVDSSSCTVECGDRSSRQAAPSPHSSVRASRETFLTLPSGRLSAQREFDCSLSTANDREPLQAAAAFSGNRDPGLTGSKKRCDTVTKDLHRSVTADDISSTNESDVTPAVCINHCHLV